MKRYLGLDVGERRIGIAVSDLLGITAQGVETWTRKNLERDIEHIFSVFDEYGAAGLVIGLPKNMNNTLGFKAEEVQDFAKALTDQRTVPVFWMDERLTTCQADQVLLSADVSRKKRRQVVDKLAAVVILQSWLDCQANTGGLT